MQRAPGGRDGVEARQRISACSAGAQPAGGQRRIPLPAAPCSGRRPGGAAPRPAAAGPAAPRASCGERPGPAGKALPVPHTSCGRCTPLSPSPPRTAPRPLLFLGAPREAAALRRSRSSQLAASRRQGPTAASWCLAGPPRVPGRRAPRALRRPSPGAERHRLLLARPRRLPTSSGGLRAGGPTDWLPAVRGFLGAVVRRGCAKEKRAPRACSPAGISQGHLRSFQSLPLSPHTSLPALTLPESPLQSALLML